MYTNRFDSQKMKQRALDAIRKENASVSGARRSPLGRLLPRILGRKPMTPLQECLAVHMYCAAPHSAME